MTTPPRLAAVAAFFMLVASCSLPMISGQPAAEWCTASLVNTVACNDATIKATNATLRERIQAGAISKSTAQKVLDTLKGMHRANQSALAAISAGEAPEGSLTKYDAMLLQAERLLGGG